MDNSIRAGQLSWITVLSESRLLFNFVIDPILEPLCLSSKYMGWFCTWKYFTIPFLSGKVATAFSLDTFFAMPMYNSRLPRQIVVLIYLQILKTSLALPLPILFCPCIFLPAYFGCLDFHFCFTGIWAGMRTVRYFDGRTYEWVGISQQPNIMGKVCWFARLSNDL